MKAWIQLRQLAIAALLQAPAQTGFAQPPSGAPPIVEQTQKNQAAPCVEPEPAVRWQDYNGPFPKLVGAFAQTLERKSVGELHYKSDTLLCALKPKDKFKLFVFDTLSPMAALETGFYAGIDQAQNRDPSFGQGAAGYGKRFGANYADQASLRFFNDFAYPTIFSEDPRYYRAGQGSMRSRFLHAIGHTFVAHRDNGRHVFNFSEWLGTASTVALATTYHPGNEPGIGPIARDTGYLIATDMGFDLLREFWPEIARKLKMPFRDSRNPKRVD